MILADTSVWVEYDRATGSPADERLELLIGEEPHLLGVTEPVLMEVLASARDERREQALRRLLLSFHVLSFDPIADFEGAARIYRRCRAAGVTPRGMLDCMIATVAHRRGAELLSHDLDMDRLAAVMSIPLAEGSLRG